MTTATTETTDTGTHTFEAFPMSHEWVLTEKIEKLNKRARRMGKPEFTVSVANARSVRHLVVLPDGGTRNIWRSVADLTVTGYVPVIDGYELVAALTRVDDGNMVGSLPGTEHTVPERFRTRHICDHCGVNRKRKSTLLLISESGEWKQIGRNCAADFFRTDTPETILNSASWWDDLIRGIGEPRGPSTYRREELVTVMATTAAVIADGGWVSGGRAHASQGMVEATSSVVSYHMYADRDDMLKAGVTRIVPTQKHIDDAQRAIDWCTGLKDDELGTGDYLYNCRLIAAAGYTSEKTWGIAVSIMATFQRHEERLKAAKYEKAATLDAWFGEVKTRYELELTITRCSFFDNDWGGSYLVMARDAEGHVFKGFFSRVPTAEAGQDTIVGTTFKVKATVKAHDTYKGVYQTTINRPKWGAAKEA